MKCAKSSWRTKAILKSQFTVIRCLDMNWNWHLRMRRKLNSQGQSDYCFNARIMSLKISRISTSSMAFAHVNSHWDKLSKQFNLMIMTFSSQSFHSYYNLLFFTIFYYILLMKQMIRNSTKFTNKRIQRKSLKPIFKNIKKSCSQIL